MVLSRDVIYLEQTTDLENLKININFGHDRGRDSKDPINDLDDKSFHDEAYPDGITDQMDATNNPSHALYPWAELVMSVISTSPEVQLRRTSRKSKKTQRYQASCSPFDVIME